MQTTHNDTIESPPELDEGSTPIKHTIYVLIRQDISIEQQLVQSAHAAAEAGRRFYKPEHGIASLIVLALPDRYALYAARDRLLFHGIQTELFFEPDFGMGHSALATEPLPNTMRRHLRRWPLWTLEKAQKAQQRMAADAIDPTPSLLEAPKAEMRILEAV